MENYNKIREIISNTNMSIVDQCRLHNVLIILDDLIEKYSIFKKT